MVDVVVSVVTYRRADDAIRAVRSVLADSKGITLTVVVVDNSEVAEPFLSLTRAFEGEKNVTLIKNPKNTGYGSGNNVALRAMRARYHLVLNPDVIITEGTLPFLVHAMDAQPNAVLLSPRVVGGDGVQQFLCKRYPALVDLLLRRLPSFIRGLFRKRLLRYEMRDVLLTKTTPVDWATGAFLFMRQDAFRKAGGFDESFFLYFEDVDLCRRMHAFGDVLYVPDVTITHMWQRDSHKRLRELLLHIRSMIRYFMKWGIKVV